MGARDPVIIPTQMARIHAKAWADPPTSGFKDTLEKNPSAALTASVRSEFGILANARLLDLGAAGYSGGLPFDQYTPEELQEIFTHGTLNGNPIEMTPSEWITPSGASIPIVQGSPPAISLSDWARIYAYIWYQYKFASPLNPAIKDHFEKDPANTLDKEIIPGLKAAGVSITYNYKTTPFIQSNPPSVPGYLTGFAAISDDPDGMGYRYRSRFTA